MITALSIAAEGYVSLPHVHAQGPFEGACPFHGVV
jgi:hypothetical protein